MAMIHSMIRVFDETRSVEFYRNAFGFQIAGRYEFESFVLIYLADEHGFELELTVNKGRAEPYDLGNGYGHLAVSVSDLAAAHGQMKSLGLAPGDLKLLSLPGGGEARFFFIADPDGYKIEVLQRGGRYK
ncbi:VOC family protein [Labrys okinawensis]|uniref:VOC family protein n=1 Tax=Labrys okinawensis TaxID=346911 RepID=UPI0039BC5625